MFDPWGGVGQFCLDSNYSQIIPHMRAKFGRGPMAVSKKGNSAALYSRPLNDNDSVPFITTPSLHFMIWLRFIDSDAHQNHLNSTYIIVYILQTS